MKLSVSFLSIKNDVLKKVAKIGKLKITYLHLDVMDGIFVLNRSYDFEQMKEIASKQRKPLDVHLMVTDVFTYVKKYITLKPRYLTFHVEAIKDPLKIISYIKENGSKAGLAIRPSTPLTKIIPYLKYVDLVLVMSVEPGFGGQKFKRKTIKRIEKLDYIRTVKKYNYSIEVDGGINDETISLVKKSDIAVVGSFITNSNQFDIQVDKLKNSLNK